MTDKLAALPEALWEEHYIGIRCKGDETAFQCVDKDSFLAALREYGQAVRRRDAEICGAMAVEFEERKAAHYRNSNTMFVPGMYYSASDMGEIAHSKDCAAAIEQEKLP